MIERRNTVQRDIVFKTLMEMDNHPNADAVYQEVQRAHSSIGRATVFRVLNRMAQDGQIQRVHNGNGADRFDHHTQKHCHIRCRECGRVDDIKLKRYPELEGEIRDSGGYKITGHHLMFEGICRACDEKSAQ